MELWIRLVTRDGSKCWTTFQHTVICHFLQLGPAAEGLFSRQLIYSCLFEFPNTSLLHTQMFWKLRMYCCRTDKNLNPDWCSCPIVLYSGLQRNQYVGQIACKYR